MPDFQIAIEIILSETFDASSRELSLCSEFIPFLCLHIDFFFV